MDKANNYSAGIDNDDNNNKYSINDDLKQSKMSH